MKVIMVMVSSVNGKITNGDNSDIYEWTSDEDQRVFLSLKKAHRLIIMGRKTYEVAKKNMRLNTKALRIVITHNPKRFKNIPGQIEFTNESPSALITRLSNYSSALLVGGGEINALFLKEHLVSEIHVTIEPWLLGRGKSLVEEMDSQIQLQLVSTKKLNEKGSMHMIYKVIT